jgi:hypothetical protein
LKQGGLLWNADCITLEVSHGLGAKLAVKNLNSLEFIVQGIEKSTFRGV